MLSKYEIEVHINSLGNFATIGILWFDDSCSAPAPFLDKEMYISPPNIIERILGITFERKVERAKTHLSRKAFKHLNQNIKLNKVLG